MSNSRILAVAVLVVAGGYALYSSAQQAGVKRTELQRQDLSVPGREVIQVRVDAYEVLYSANGFSPRIALKNAGNYIGQLLFLPNGAALPADTVVNKQAQLHYHLEDFRNVVDLLRNEKPIYLYYSGSGSGFENGIKTMIEKVGEGEIVQQD